MNREASLTLKTMKNFPKLMVYDNASDAEREYCKQRGYGLINLGKATLEIGYENIKQEAIKWIKELEKENKKITITGMDTTLVISTVWIKHFFNITDEELK